jgi:hypothetical protein
VRDHLRRRKEAHGVELTKEGKDGGGGSDFDSVDGSTVAGVDQWSGG